MPVKEVLEKYSKELGKQVTKFSSYAIDLLKKYDFPGNIRELRNVLEQATLMTDDAQLGLSHFAAVLKLAPTLPPQCRWTEDK